jgi:rhamnose transport system substrate-binding protein
MTSRLSKRTLALAVAALCGLGIIGGVAYAASLQKGLKAFVIPKNLGNSYFTTADSVKTGGALAAFQALGENGTETSGSAATAASQLPAIQAAIAKGAKILLVSATDPTALCPTLKQAIAKGITVVTYDSDAPTCRTLFINQASTANIGESEVDAIWPEPPISLAIASTSLSPMFAVEAWLMNSVRQVGASES